MKSIPISDSLIVHAAPSGNYRIDCPACKATQAGNIKEWPPQFPNPFSAVCACRHSFQVLVNIRSHHRKPGRLLGEYRLMQRGRPIEGLCTVLDITQMGMRMEANHLTNVLIGDLIHLVVTFNDAAHSRVPLSGSIRWVRMQHKRVMMGIRFENLPPHSQQMLGFYVL